MKLFKRIEKNIQKFTLWYIFTNTCHELFGLLTEIWDRIIKEYKINLWIGFTKAPSCNWRQSLLCYVKVAHKRSFKKPFYYNFALFKNLAYLILIPSRGRPTIHTYARGYFGYYPFMCHPVTFEVLNTVPYMLNG